ncbi:odorant receptor Or2-like [Sitophilus oryzae]|uniref:Odorant receptor Or2-like n=1 Tax=Sitophilus oryzae TaxID=7048 RepID=A0A6J2X1W0_SITOR|nr:odorant receptor Or2-like [Sitophilus oryzae]
MFPANLLDLIFWVLFLVMLIKQLFFLAWHGNEIQLLSTGISDALYESNWNKQPNAVRQIILIIMMRVQRPLNIYIGPFYPITIGTALGTMKAAYSYVTMIVGMDSQKS